MKRPIDGMLAGADQVQVLALDLVHHGIHLREGHNALHHVAVHHEGREYIGKALADHKVTGVSQHCLVQAGNVAQQVVEALASHAACGIHINAVKALHDLGVVRDLKIRHHRLAKALCFHIAAVVRANGHAEVDHRGGWCTGSPGCVQPAPAAGSPALPYGLHLP